MTSTLPLSIHTHTTVSAMSFNALPLEIKEAIWQLALAAVVDHPEICIAWPIKSSHYNRISTPLLVDTAFPVLMHVCGQWRDFVLSSFKRPASPIKLRFSRLANCQVPYRPFRPATDILYSSAMNYERAISCRYFELGPDIPLSTLAGVRHLAVDWPLWIGAGNWLPEMIFRACRDLEKVLGSSSL